MIPTIIYSAQDIAGANIARALISKHSFTSTTPTTPNAQTKTSNSPNGSQSPSRLSSFPTFKNGSILLVEIPSRTVFSENLLLPGDYCIFASRHASETGAPSFTVHPIGNWGKAELGGKEKTLVTAFASKMKVALLELSRLAQARGFSERLVCYEVTHHGPYLEKPTLFVEVGSSEKEWREEKACELVADAIMHTVDSKEQFDSFFGVGGGHYAPTFTKDALTTSSAFGHMLPKYAADNLVFEAFKQGIEKCVEHVQGVVIDWKGVNKQQRDQILEYCKQFGVEWKRR